MIDKYEVSRGQNKLMFFPTKDPWNWNLHSSAAAKSSRRPQPSKALDHDRWSPSASTRHQEHGLPEVLQHGAVALHSARQTWRTHRRPWCTRPSQTQYLQPLQLEVALLILQVTSIVFNWNWVELMSFWLGLYIFWTYVWSWKKNFTPKFRRFASFKKNQLFSSSI